MSTGLQKWTHFDDINIKKDTNCDANYSNYEINQLDCDYLL